VNELRKSAGAGGAPRNFFLYAHPCGDVLVRRGTVRAGTLRRLRASVARGEFSGLDPWMFAAAIARVREFASRRRRRLDAGEVTRYFLYEHNALVRETAKEKSDVVPEMCFITPAVVLRPGAGSCAALTPAGAKTINTRYCEKLEAGDFISTHYGFACEKISARALAALWRELE
jgi:hydrogenase maturation factor